MVFLYLTIKRSVVQKWIFVFLLFGQYMLHSQSLEDYRWQNRLLFILNPDSEQVLQHQQLKVLQDYKSEMIERDLIIFIVTDSDVLDSNGNVVDLKKENIPFADYNGLVLVGKDGGVKLRKPFVVSPQEVFNLIDSMPMRRVEMKKSKQD